MAKKPHRIGQTPSLIALLVLLCTGGLLGAAGPCLAADNAALAISAVLLSNNQCKFNTNSALLNFGNLDPGNPVDATATASLVYVCRGSDPVAVFFFSDDDGLHETGPNANRMQHSTLPAQYLPYSFSLNPVSGMAPKNVVQTLTVTGTVRGADYQTALGGTYSDTVTIAVLP